MSIPQTDFLSLQELTFRKRIIRHLRNAEFASAHRVVELSITILGTPRTATGVIAPLDEIYPNEMNELRRWHRNQV